VVRPVGLVLVVRADRPDKVAAEEATLNAFRWAEVMDNPAPKARLVNLALGPALPGKVAAPVLTEVST
jgi:hypothetical protein